MAISLTALEFLLGPLAGASGGSEIGVVVTKSFLINLSRATYRTRSRESLPNDPNMLTQAVAARILTASPGRNGATD